MEKNIASIVNKLRVKRGWSIAELARAARLVETTVYRVEKGTDPRYTTLTALASALGVKVSELTGEEMDNMNRLQPDHPGVEALAQDIGLCQENNVTAQEINSLRRWQMPDPETGEPMILQTRSEALGLLRGSA